MLIRAIGKIQFEPQNKTRKHKSQSSWKRVALITTDDDLDLYYSWFLAKRFNLKLNRSIRGSHITFISDKFEHSIKNIVDKYDGKEIEFYYDLEPRSNGEHWWLRVYCSFAEDIREEAGLTREPYFSFHLTLGYANEKNLHHSNYILEQCKFFNLISSEPRKPFDIQNVVALIN